ncbi:HlyD family type I secretion periplasmic adaptor subunit [Thalassobaculum sp. OXR-137]|uniref:HlyD family type I secretion periplasmic adaptor subunit n=1 Tax=Thalassobaculum sp. OXR-137 TaxID=3100173 RepID=UPI002AC99FE2|nr:HlyD family type I secretion periplasmic adaptor subunit [Thalassobaculum sp. OXR-137]WPZ33532.1 HlyD family type I secretion periplasmic adaptor subunit [Thalassobaculum sp. OXR-137]
MSNITVSPRPGRAAGTPAVRRTSYLAQSIHLEESSSPRLIRLTILLLAFAVAGAIVWAAMARLDQVARADGKVIPSSNVTVLQHLEGGLVEQVLVRPGDIVEPGQTVIKMSGTGAGSELRQLRTREASLAARLERLYAQIQDREPDFSPWRATYPELTKEQSELLAASRATSKDRMQLFDEQLKDQNIQLTTLLSQRKTIEDSIKLIEEEERLRKELLDKGLTRRFTYLDVLRDLNRTRGQLVQLEGLIARNRQEIAEIEARRVSFESTNDNQALSEITTISAERAEVAESISRFEDRFARLDIKSPIRGVVQDLTVSAPGSVIAPGAAVAQIVPIDDENVVEVLLNPKDVAFVSPGQEATVRVTAYDFAQFGGMPGKVERISPTTVASGTGASFYTVVIRLDRNHFGEEAGKHMILPGMIVQADIRTSDRTLLDYLAKPITRAFQIGFTER